MVGYGFGGRYFHAPLIAGAPGCELVGVVTRSAERRAEVAAEHPGVAVHDSVDDLVAAGVDAVAVSTPAGTHSAVTDDLLRRGIPVVCDKPFALDVDAARRTVDSALAALDGLLVGPLRLPPGVPVIDVSRYRDVRDLYVTADLLVTDYSSVMFDYAVLDRPLAIYAADWKKYKANRGAYLDVFTEGPGVAARTESVSQRR